jgi:hypothetical protein
MSAGAVLIHGEDLFVRNQSRSGGIVAGQIAAEDERRAEDRP